MTVTSIGREDLAALLVRNRITLVDGLPAHLFRDGVQGWIAHDMPLDPDCRTSW